MTLQDLLLAAQSGPFSCEEGDAEFFDVLHILANEGAGMFNDVVRTVSTHRDGEIGRCTAVAINGGLNALGQLALRA